MRLSGVHLSHRGPTAATTAWPAVSSSHAVAAACSSLGSATLLAYIGAEHRLVD